MTTRKNRRQQRRGAIAVLTAILMIPILGAVALAIDLGLVAMAYSELQAAADSAAIAGATLIKADLDSNSQIASREAAVRFAAAHRAVNDSIVLDPISDIEYGFWDRVARVLLPPRQGEVIKINAIRVRLHRDASNAVGPIRHLLAPVLGIASTDAVVEAIAYIPDPSPTITGEGTRFLIDDEMFDTDIPAIEDLAAQMGVTPDYLLSSKVPQGVAQDDPDNPMTDGSLVPEEWDWTDWFLNIPKDTILELPTGQAGDEGLMDLASNVGSDLPQYPFAESDAHTTFLRYNETTGLNNDVPTYQDTLLTSTQLDPIDGVGRFNQPGRYPELINLNFVHVSPVYKSDLSALNGVTNTDENNGPDLLPLPDGDGEPDGYTTNQPFTNGVNAKGERRGLVAFKIIDVTIDPGRPYPYLPNLVIEIVDPSTVNLSEINPVDRHFSGISVFSTGGTHNIRIVR